MPERQQNGDHAYAKPPIAEAILDVRIAPADASRLPALLEAMTALAADYPNFETVSVASGSIQLAGAEPVGPAVQANFTQHQLGFRRSSGDGKTKFNMQLDGFSFFRLAPYTQWREIAPEAQRVWSKYREAITPNHIVRVAVRYINKIEIPAPAEQLSDYLNLLPKLPPGLGPQSPSEFVTRFVLKQADIDASLILHEAVTEPLESDRTVVILDVDVFREVSVPQTDADLWAYFEALRARKNKIFEACITDRCRALFE